MTGTNPFARRSASSSIVLLNAAMPGSGESSDTRGGYGHSRRGSRSSAKKYSVTPGRGDQSRVSCRRKPSRA